MNALWTIARLEFVSAVRLKWLRLLTIAFGLIAASAAYAAGAAGEMIGADGFARTTMTLVPVVLILIPIAALVLGVSGQAADDGGEPFLFAQPVSRSVILVGRWIGQVGALGGGIAAGFAIGGWIVAANAGASGLGAFAIFILLSVVLAAIFLSLAGAIGAVSSSRTAALGLATFVWFVCVLLFDTIALSVAGQMSGSIGGRLLFVSVFVNPVDLVRILMLFGAAVPNVLGAAGEAWTRFFGGEGRAIAAAVAALTVWTIAPLGLGAVRLRARDL